MKLELSVGDIVDLTDAKTGVNSQGEWLLAKVRSEKGADTIDVFASGDNAKEAKDWDTGKVTAITKIRRSARQYNGKWIAIVAVDVKLSRGPAKSLHHPGDEFRLRPTTSTGSRLIEVAGMIKKCACGGNLHVVQTVTVGNRLIWRRRLCENCRKIIYTVEVEQKKSISQLLAEERHAQKSH